MLCVFLAVAWCIWGIFFSFFLQWQHLKRSSRTIAHWHERQLYLAIAVQQRRGASWMHLSIIFMTSHIFFSTGKCTIVCSTNLIFSDFFFFGDQKKKTQNHAVDTQNNVQLFWVLFSRFYSFHFYYALWALFIAFRCENPLWHLIASRWASSRLHTAIEKTRHMSTKLHKNTIIAITERIVREHLLLFLFGVI